MIWSHVAYVVAFITFGLMTSIPALFAAMFAVAVGEAFRTGTHQAINFAWLIQEGREQEKTPVYGMKCSWLNLSGGGRTAIELFVQGAYTLTSNEIVSLIDSLFRSESRS